MAVYKVDGARLVETPDPFEGVALDEGLREAGYLRDLTTELYPDSPNATVYSKSEGGRRQFYVDVNGSMGQLAGILANDFSELLTVLKLLDPLLTLIEMDHASELHAEKLGAEASEASRR